MFYTYILLLANDTYYTGYTSNLKQRLHEHSEGKVAATSRYLPAELAYYAAFRTKHKALDFEKYLKTFSGFAFRNKRLI